MKGKWAWAGIPYMLAVLVGVPNVVWAQQSPLGVGNMDRIAGVGVGIAPDYLGSDDYRFVVVPFLTYNFPGLERTIVLIGTDLQINVVNHPWLRIGPVLNLRRGRGDVDNDAVDRMENIDATVQAGAFIGAEFKDPANKRARLVLSIEYLHDVGGAYNSYLVTGSARGGYPVSPKVDVSLGVSTTYGGHSYMQTYFGVDPDDSARSGLEQYSLGSGFRDVSIMPSVVYHLTRSWHLGMGVRYVRLVGSASTSPVVDVGSKDQFIAGFGVGYSW
jgi:MipA family protein